MSVTKFVVLLILFDLSFSLGQSNIKLFNLKDYGAVEGGNVDISQALLRAWNDACKWKGRSRVEISRGSTYLVNPVKLKGPCSGKTGFLNLGTLKAPRGLRGNYWIEFQYIDRLAVYGTGIFDGQGPPAMAGPNLPTVNLQCSGSTGKGTSITGVAVNLQCSGSNPCQKIELKDINIMYVKDGGRTVSTCANVNGQALGVQIPKSCIP